MFIMLRLYNSSFTQQMSMYKLLELNGKTACSGALFCVMVMKVMRSVSDNYIVNLAPTSGSSL